jgi:uncharacterized protein YcbX
MRYLSQLYIYPIKSCRGIKLSEAEISRRGLQHDREFLVVDASGEFLTQRDTPRLALVTPDITRGQLSLSSPGFGSLSVRLDSDQENFRVTKQVQIWNDWVTADDMGEEAADWFSEFLGFRTFLVRIGSSYSRVISPSKIPPAHQGSLIGPEVSFADAYPYMVLSEESLEHLNSRLSERLGMDRFRPNLVVAECGAPYEEDAWTVFRTDGLTFRHRGPCVRCVITTTDQTTLRRGPEPLRTLARYRRGKDGGVIFGMNFFCEQKSGKIRVGAPITVED